MDLTKIKEAAEREQSRIAEGFGWLSVRGAEDRAAMVAAVPDLLTEIERLEKESDWRRETLVKMTESKVAADAEIERRGALLASLCQAGDRAMELLDASDVGPRDRVTIALARAIEAATS